MDLVQILESDGIPAFVSGSFADTENFPDPCWVFTNMMTTNYSTDADIRKEVLRYTIALYSSDPSGLREKVKNKQRELVKNGALVGGIADWKTNNPTLFGYGFECDIIQEY